MENVQICEIAMGGSSTYPHIVSKDEKNIFCCSNRLENYKIGDKVYCIYKSLNKAFFAVISSERIPTKENFLLDEWVFEYEDQRYIARQGDVMQLLHVLDQRIIPPDWGWRRPLNSQVYPIWNTHIDDALARLAKVNDLQRIFKKGPGFKLLESCSKLLRQHSEMKENGAVAQELPVPKITLYEPCIPKVSELPFSDTYRQVLMAIKTKPFILLAGISGVGKSRLVRTLAYKTCIETTLRYPDKPGNFELIKVKPDWLDSSELMGYTTQRSGSLRYNVTPFIRFIVKAWRYQHIPFFLCLDEMNLARVEQYFAEFLSILETRRFNEDRLYSDPFICREDIQLYSEEDESFWKKLGSAGDEDLCRQFLSSGITIPPNLIVMGTVNVDETTHSFSRKVFDRAMTIEMNEVDMNKGVEVLENDWEYPEKYISATFLLGQLQDINEAYNINPVAGRLVLNELEEINALLLNSSFRFGYRARNEILTYCIYNGALLPLGTPVRKWLYICLDEMIMMKILSRIEGNEKKCSSIIKSLLVKLAHNYPTSHKKLLQMQGQLNNNGYTSFWN
jgi:hypothetical protein